MQDDFNKQRRRSTTSGRQSQPARKRVTASEKQSRSTQRQKTSSPPTRQEGRSTSTSSHSRDSYRVGTRHRVSAEQSDPSQRRSNRTPTKYAAYDGGPPKQTLLSNPRMLIGIAVVVVALIVGLVFLNSVRPITITVNGTEQQLHGKKNLETVVSEGYASPRAGNFVAIDGEVLRAGEGQPMQATVDGEYTEDYTAKLKNNAVVVIENGNDIVEDSQTTTKEVDFESREEGYGPITVLETEGKKGVENVITGSESGKTITEETQQKQDQVFRKYTPNVGNDKVIALTLDDGPWGNQTKEILDVLKEHDVKATFFVVGDRIKDDGPELVKRMHDEGHQVATHSYSHARGEGKGVDMGHMSPEAQIEEVTKGYEAIKEVTGEEPSHVFRSPGGNYSVETMSIVAPYVRAEIRWTIDTEDWRKPGADVIVQQMQSVKPGSIVLAHDGGGTRTDTIEGLSKALPLLKDQGYRFITIDELLEYPRA